MNEPTNATLNIRLLGDFCLEYDGAPVTGVNTPRLQSLLAYLLLHRDAPQSRAHLAFQFWPDSAESQARSNLRTLLHRLRRALLGDATYLVVDAQTGSIAWYGTLSNITLVGGTLCALIYFFFSVEHKGVFGKASKIGIWIIMITFGAAFGYTVMGRVALLVGRMEFLFVDWLHIASP